MHSPFSCRRFSEKSSSSKLRQKPRHICSERMHSNSRQNNTHSAQSTFKRKHSKPVPRSNTTVFFLEPIQTSFSFSTFCSCLPYKRLPQRLIHDTNRSWALHRPQHCRGSALFVTSDRNETVIVLFSPIALLLRLWFP